jgi:predicted tellurium resistance membrane protein TerC
MLFGQTFELHDLAVVGLLVVLEGVLSIDNALVLGLLAKRLPKHQQKRALTYGLVGAFVFRIIAIATAVWLMKWWFVKLIGGGYLVYIAVKHLFFESKEDAPEHVGTTPDGDVVLVDERGQPVSDAAAENALRERSPVFVPDATDDEEATAGPGVATAAYQALEPDCDATGRLRKCAKFWPTVVVIELTDIAFAIDSILAAIAMVGSAPPGTHGLHPKFWVVVAGGMLGVILMRVAAIAFIRMLDRFPRFETAAYLLVALIGLKLLVDWYFNKPPKGHPSNEVFHGPVDFHSPSNPAFWVFWIGMLVCFCIGFIPPKKRREPPVSPA